MAPFLYFDNKTLFFASDGYAGMGRKDIYKVDVEQVTPPLNIGITVNTQRDEFGFMVDIFRRISAGNVVFTDIG